MTEWKEEDLRKKATRNGRKKSLFLKIAVWQPLPLLKIMYSVGFNLSKKHEIKRRKETL